MNRAACVPLIGAAILASAIPTSPGLAAPPEAPATVSVTPDPQGSSGIVHGQVDINAPPETVWKVMVDCARLPQLMVDVKSCRVLQRDPAGRWDMREQISKGSILPSVRIVMRSDFDEPRSVKFHRTDGDFKVLEGQWLLEPLDGGARTRVLYESRMTAPFAAPGPIVRAILRRDMPKTLDNLRTASESAPQTARIAETRP